MNSVYNPSHLKWNNNLKVHYPSQMFLERYCKSLCITCTWVLIENTMYWSLSQHSLQRIHACITKYIQELTHGPCKKRRVLIEAPLKMNIPSKNAIPTYKVRWIWKSKVTISHIMVECDYYKKYIFNVGFVNWMWLLL
jgi:hypothetical protein